MPLEELPRPADVQAAAVRLRGRVHRTPVFTSRDLDALLGARVFFKCENLQRTGAFKFRGATHAVGRLNESLRSVATHSSGNHAAALACAARERGLVAHVVMPRDAPEVKQAAVRHYDGRITFCEPTLAARECTLQQVLSESGATFIPPYDHPDIITGQGTSALELLEDCPDLDLIIAPVGGGGLLSGTALAVAGTGRGRVIGAEPARVDDARRSLATGVRQPPVPADTVADGLRTALGEIPFALLQAHRVEVLTVTEKGIVRAMRWLAERMKLVVEPSGATGLALLLEKPEIFSGCRVGVILSGGNVDLARWSRLV